MDTRFCIEEACDHNSTKLVFVFRPGKTTWNSFVAKVTKSGKCKLFSHVDIIVHNKEHGENTLLAYSSFMHNPLLKTRIDENCYDKTSDVALAFDVSSDETQYAREFLDTLVNRNTQYNYTDISLCVLPKTLQSLYKDVTMDQTITKVFCSQLAVLTLRAALRKHQNIYTSTKINSRCTSPNALFELIEPSCKRVKVELLCVGQLEEF